MRSSGDNRQRLIDFVRERGGDIDNLVAVDLGLFFEGNTDAGSIAPNLDHPGPQRIWHVLSEIEERADVSAVQPVVWLEETSDNQFYDDTDEWPFAESVLVVTSLSPAEVDRLTASVQTDPSDVVDEPNARNASPLPHGHHYVRVWWD